MPGGRADTPPANLLADHSQERIARGPARTCMRRCRRRTGGVLIVVLGVLAVLALLGVTFSSLQAVERQVSRNYLDSVRAKLIAQSGVEAAVAQLSSLVLDHPFPDPRNPAGRAWVYYGDETDEANPPQVATPLHRAKNPSFAWEDEKLQDPSDANSRPRLIPIEGVPCGLSGSTGGTYSLRGDQYALRVRDLSGLLHVNDGVEPHGGNAGAISQNLRRVLNRLGDVLGAAGLGDRIVGRRPALGYRAPHELEGVLGTTDYRKAEPFLTTVAWLDPNVAQPVPHSAEHAARMPVRFWRGEPPVYRRGRGLDAWGRPVAEEAAIYDGLTPPDGSNAVFALDELFPQWIEIVSRAPVNVNAAPREVLIALLSDLKGVFVVHRKRNNLCPVAGGYLIPTLIHTYSPQGSVPPFPKPVRSEGDEYGFLCETAPIRYLGTSTTAAGGAVDAAKIADEILACRERRGRYAGLPFGGPFRAWKQWNAFCDDLVRSGLLQDPRACFFEHKLSGPDVVKGGNLTGYGPLVPSEAERQVASQALADVLKANFNPNLHLNETNPDANLHLLVDKTDLVVNSTEFVFTPTGCFEIESVGRVLRGRDAQDVFLARDNELVATHKIVAAVRLFDLYRETAQAQFSRGTLPPSGAGRPGTSGGVALEVGPEPDNGPAPGENEWGGYVALATVGGLRASKRAGELLPTPPEPDDAGETIGVHFQRDFDAHRHADGVRQELASSASPGESTDNFPDPGEIRPGPYAPTHGPTGRHRLARSFRLPAGGGTSALPALAPYAPLDLRIDGGYSERHAAPAWWASPASFVANAKEMDFAVSFWVKPSYPPARSGKPRVLFNAIRHSAKRWVLRGVADEGEQNWLALWYNAGHEATGPGAVFPTEDMAVFGELWWHDLDKLWYGHVPFRPCAFIFGRGYGYRTMAVDDEIRTIIYNSATVNHEGHADGRPTLFRENRWTHVTLVAAPRPAEYQRVVRDWYSMRSPQFNRILVNGLEVPLTLEAFQNHDRNPGNGTLYTGDARLDWTKHANGDCNPIRFGTPSHIVSSWTPQRANFACDATIDELYVRKGGSVGEPRAKRQFLLGRYARPAEPAEETFRSAELRLDARPRILPPASAASPPLGPGPTLAGTRDLEVVGVAWTAYGEDASDLEASVTDASNGGKLPTTVTLQLQAGGRRSGPFGDEGFSRASLRVPAGSSFRYLARIEVGAGAARPILLSTPVLDDVTIYARPPEGIRYLYYISMMVAGYSL